MDYRSVNKVILIGNIGKDAEIKFTQNNFAICSFSIATTERYKPDPNADWVEKTEWHRCVLVGKRAETIVQYLKKGTKVYIEGKIHTREWQDKEGNRRYSTDIKVDTVEFLGGKPSDSSTAPGSYQDYEAYAGTNKKSGVTQQVEEPSRIHK